MGVGGGWVYIIVWGEVVVRGDEGRKEEKKIRVR